jgi:hypothetical protein
MLPETPLYTQTTHYMASSSPSPGSKSSTISFPHKLLKIFLKISLVIGEELGLSFLQLNLELIHNS